MTNTYIQTIKVKHAFDICIYVYRTKYRECYCRGRRYRGENLLEKTVNDEYR
jgi:hypothetical protein